MAQPSPMSMTPAFSSPAFTSTRSPVVGNLRSSLREFLYEQCSLHITEKMPSSVKLGSRPRMDLMRSYSSGVRPCLLTSSGVMAGSADIRKLRNRNSGDGVESGFGGGISALREG